MIETVEQAQTPTVVRWAWHVLAGAVVLVVTSLYVGFDGYFFIDEAAIHGQMEVMDAGNWTMARPFAEADPGGDHVPMANAYTTEEAFAPFVKHPLHVALAFGAHQVAGDVGVRLLSSLGVLAAAIGAGALASPRGRATAIVAFWLTLVASPLLFHAQLVLAHGLAAAVAAALVLSLTRVGPTVVAAAWVFVLSAVGAMLRSEFLLLAGAAAVVYVGRGVWRRRPGDVLLGASAGVAAVVTHRLEPVIVERLVGGEADPSSLPSTSGSREGLAEVLAGAGRSLLDVGGSTADIVAPLSLMVAVVLAALAVVVMSRDEPDPGLVRFASVGAAAAAAVHILDAHVARGLIWAFPAVLLLVIPLMRRMRLTGAERGSLTITGVFATFVVVTQYSGGGGHEWGWRYSSIALPIVAPILSAALVWLWRRRPVVPTTATLAVAATFVLVSFSGIVAQRRLVSDTAYFVDRVEATVRDSGADYVVSHDPSFGRFAYALTTGGRVASIEDGGSRSLLRLLAESGIERVLLVWRGESPPPDVPLGPFRLTDERYYIASDYRAATLVLD